MRDDILIRATGTLVVMSGGITLITTALTTLILGFNGGSNDLNQFIRGLAGIMLALAMSSILVGCGLPLMQFRKNSIDKTDLAHNWTALVLGMTISGIIALWSSTVLSVLAAIILLGLMACRSAIIRQTHS